MSINPRLPLEASVIYKREPDIFMRPSYRISPFSTSDISRLQDLKCSLNTSHLLSDFFGGLEFKLTESGRMAIEIALEEIGVKKQDLVSIVTTSNNYYVSGCVTSAIEKHCRWNRAIVPETAVIFVIHEFGCLYKTVKSLKKYGVPIIEDYAHSFASRYTGSERFGDRLIGDYAVFSFPKFIPVQFGGAVVKTKLSSRRQYVDHMVRAYLESVLAEFLVKVNSLIIVR